MSKPATCMNCGSETNHPTASAGLILCPDCAYEIQSTNHIFELFEGSI